MRTLALTISIVCATAVPVEAGSRTLPPVDQCGGETSFTRFRTTLKQAAARKDRAALMKLVAPDVRTTFGGQGAKAFAQGWDYSEDDTWDRLKDILRMGCARSGDARVLPSFPIQFARFAGEPDFENLELARPGAKLLEDPENEQSVIATLSWELVTAVSTAGDYWTGVRLEDGREGWISDADIYHPADVHLVVRKRRGKWMITEYVYGPWAE